MMNKISVWVLLLLFISCSPPGDDPIKEDTKKDSDWRTVSYQGKYGNYRYTQAELPDATSLFEIQTGTRYTGTSASPNVIVYSQGGPGEKLNSDFGYKDLFDELSTQSDWQVVKVYQKQILNLKSEFALAEITANEGAAAASWSSAALFKVAKYWNTTKGKKVYIISHSYGSFLVPKMLADWKYEDYVEKVLVLAGRLQMPSAVYDIFAAGNAIGFQDGDGDGLFRETVAPLEITRTATDAAYVPQDTVLTKTEFFYWTRNSRKLQSGVGQFDYVDIYQKNNVPLTKVLFASGKKDPAVGYFTDTEISFARTSANYHDSDGTHSVSEPADLKAYVRFLE
ncbi:hypothetical protein P0082_05955 [Candidatus Haliotispira prima]|uniref:Uncharacterized protein n=1 Tax=Candidatus Haliotispira prima TaxID=3034016 RepID=A0ABY8MLB3_9SPIO|nr:hypothetical protein P0082_05955 [Candidatus Haliotispira prima]